MQKYEILLNQELFKRAIVNLLNNTFRHNPDGCRIYINLYKENKKTVLEIAEAEYRLKFYKDWMKNHMPRVKASENMDSDLR